MKRELLFLVIFVLVSSIVSAQATSFQAEESLKTIRNAYNFLETKGLGGERFADLMSAAELSNQEKAYDEVLSIEQEMIMLRDLALSLQERIGVLNASLAVLKEEEYADLFTLFEEVVREFSTSNYEHAKTIVDSLDGQFAQFSEQDFATILTMVNKSRLVILELDVSLSSPSRIEEEARTAKEEGDYATISVLAESATTLHLNLKALLNVRSSIHQVKEAGLVPSRMEDVFSEALFSLEQEKYDQTASLIEEIDQLKEEALSLQDLIRVTTKSVEEATLDGLNTEEAQVLIDQSKEKLLLNDYDRGTTLIGEAQKKLEKIQADALLFGVVNKSDVKFNIILFLKKTWWMFLAIILVLSIIGIFTFHSIMTRVLEYRIERLEKEKHVIIELIKKYQHDYYKEHKISKDSYETVVDDHQQRLLRIRELLPLFQDKLNKHRDKSINGVKKD